MKVGTLSSPKIQSSQIFKIVEFFKNVDKYNEIFLIIDEDDEVEADKKNRKTEENDELEMTPLIQRKEDEGENKSNHNGDCTTHKDKNQLQKERNESSKCKGNDAKNQINIDAVVEPVLKIQIEPPSNTSDKNSGEIKSESEIKTKVYLEFQTGKVQYPQSDSDSQSSGSTHRALEATNNVHTEKELGTKVTFKPPQDAKLNETKDRFKLRRSSSCGKLPNS